MSLTDKKNALFGSGTGGAKAASQKPHDPTRQPAPSSAPKVRGAFGGISDAARAQKKKEAEKLKEEGEAYLKTSVFQWSPDYMGAAPKFEGASRAYAAAGETPLAREMSLECSKAYEGYESLSSAANAMQTASKLSKDMKSFEQSVTDLIKAADLWGRAGDMIRVAQIYVNIAESVGVTEDESAEYFGEAVNIMIPPSSSDSDLKRYDVKSVEVLKKLLKFNLSKGSNRYPEAMKNALLLIRVCEAFAQDTQMWKALATVTVLHLTNKDVIAAEETYIQTHLSKSGYAATKEAELVDSMINAFKLMDEAQLQEVQKSPNLFYLDREVKDLVLKLTITSSSTTPKAVSSIQVTTEVSEVKERNDGASEEVETVVSERQVVDDDDDVDLT